MLAYRVEATRKMHGTHAADELAVAVAAALVVAAAEAVADALETVVV